MNKSKKGFTLVEVLIVTVIFTFLEISASVFFYHIINSYNTLVIKTKLRLIMMETLRQIEKEIKQSITEPELEMLSGSGQIHTQPVEGSTLPMTYHPVYTCVSTFYLPDKNTPLYKDSNATNFTYDADRIYYWLGTDQASGRTNRIMRDIYTSVGGGPKSNYGPVPIIVDGDDFRNNPSSYVIPGSLKVTWDDPDFRYEDLAFAYDDYKMVLIGLRGSLLDRAGKRHYLTLTTAVSLLGYKLNPNYANYTFPLTNPH